MEVVDVEKAKSIDKETMDKVGIPGIVLMENAAQNIFNYIVHKGNKFLFFCGVGNNGGDGLALARKLFLVNKDITIYVIGNLEKASDEFLINYNILRNIGVEINLINGDITFNVIEDLKAADIVVDSIMGIGLNRDIKGVLYDLIGQLNKNSKYIISIDNPTGLNADTGKIMGIAVKACETFIIEVLKKGYFNSGAKEYLGKINMVEIGVPHIVKEKNSDNVRMMDKEYYKQLIPIRGIYGHKGSYGRAVILAGSIGMTGAAYITTEAALDTGAGLVSLVLEKEIQPILSSKLTEAMTVNYNETNKINKLINDANVIICGPGLSTNEANKTMLYKFINESKCPMVLDADALNIVSKDNNLLKKLEHRAIFTPHAGEMVRLTGKSIEEIQGNRIDVCREYSKNNIILLLKGYNTVISDGDRVIINNTGNSKMASGGMGDCLTGIIGGLVSQGISMYDAAVLGAFIHGAIGDKLSEKKYVVTAKDIINEISNFMEGMLRK